MEGSHVTKQSGEDSNLGCYRVSEEGFDFLEAANTLATARRLYSEWGRMDDFETFEQLLEYLRSKPKFSVVPLRNLLDKPESGRVTVSIRFDIDVDPFAALELARIAARYSVPTTFYVLHTAAYYLQAVQSETGRPEFNRNPWLNTWLEAMIVAGPEIGLHIDPFLFTKTHGVDGADAVKTEINFIRSNGLPLRSVTAHNSAPAYGAENFEIFREFCFRSDGTPELATDELPLGSLTLADVGIDFEANFPMPAPEYDPEAFREWVSSIVEMPVENELWMRRNLLHNPGYRHRYNYEIWHLGPGRWVLAGKHGEQGEKWLFNCSFKKILHALAALPAGATVVFVLHPEYFAASFLRKQDQPSFQLPLHSPVLDESSLSRLRSVILSDSKHVLGEHKFDAVRVHEPRLSSIAINRLAREIGQLRSQVYNLETYADTLKRELDAAQLKRETDLVDLRRELDAAYTPAPELRHLAAVLRASRPLLAPLYRLARLIARGLRACFRLPRTALYLSKRTVAKLLGSLRPILRPAKRSYLKAYKVAIITRTLMSGAIRPSSRKKVLGKRVLMLTTSQLAIDPRIPKVAFTLADAGYEVDVMAYTTNPEQPTALVTEEVRPRVRYLWVRHINVYDGIWRIYQREFVEFGMNRVYDIVHANDLTTLLAAWFIARKSGRMLVYDAHEMWAENVILRNGEYVPIEGWRRWLANFAERFLVRRVDLFSSVSGEICREYKRRFHLPAEPFLLPNFPLKESLTASEPDQATVPELIRAQKGDLALPEGAFITIYLGGINPLRNIENVIRAHGLLSNEFHFVIRGPYVNYYAPSYLALAEQCGAAGRVHLLEGVTQQQLMGAAKGCDCGIVMLKNLCKNFYWFYPNKFFEYMFMRLPVACSDFPEVSAHVKHEKCGVVFDPEDPASIAAALRRLAGDRNEARAMGERGYTSAMERYSWESIEPAYVAAYEAARAKQP
ncbi:MAG: hypothetical protein C3F19_14600 [Rhodocyclales bacterium]|nr:MAG: hypothetical protein C3F19_14600 [Rhodocyclales bacterium]